MKEVDVIAEWRFTVYQVDDAPQVGVEITVYDSDDTTQTVRLLSEGDLAVAVLAAYDALGLVCPLVPDNDTARLANSALYKGYDLLDEHPTNGDEL